MGITRFSEKDNTLYICTDAIIPKGVKPSELRIAMRESYEDRIKKYATQADRAEIEKELKAHEGCSISEYMDI